MSLIGIIAQHYVDEPVGGGAYSAEVMADSPLGYWRLGDSSGTTAADSSGNGRNGTYFQTPTLGVAGLLAGDADTAVSFDAAQSEYMERSHGAWMDVTTFTAEAIIKPDLVTGTRTIMARHGNTWTFRQDGDRLGFYVWYSAGSFVTCQSAAGTLSAGQVYHVAATWVNGVGSTIYVNGSPVATTGSSNSIVTTSAPLRLAASGAGELYDGVIDEAAFYGTALSAARVSAHNGAR